MTERNSSHPTQSKHQDRGSWLGLRPDTLVALVLIAVLLVPLSALSQPRDSSNPGGYLARLRTEAQLSQADLGEIDPTSETMRLATLGLKNIAVTLLWDRANFYKKVEDWTNLSAVLEQMTKLQPNFYSVWDFQAHNLSYNISVQFDDYHDRYAWVMKGIEFLRQGVFFNTREPRLLGRMGWFIGQKIGRADEKIQYRRLFKADDDFHERDRPGRTLIERDNWLVGREKYLAAQKLVDSGAPLKTTPLIFHSEPMMGYSLDNIAPGVPGGLMAVAFDEMIEVSWSFSNDEDFQYFIVEKSTTEDFASYESFETIDTLYSDLEYTMNASNYYRVAAVDYAGNISDYSDVVDATVLSLVDNTLPEVYAIHQNYPNPFNPTTSIKYQLPEESMVNLIIYDVMGRKVMSLINSHRAAGYHSVQWDATNDLGQPVSAGMYIYTIQAGDYREVRKMILLK